MANSQTTSTKSIKLITYVYEAKTNRGEVIRGEIDAQSLAFAKADLRKQGYVVKKIYKKPKSFSLFGSAKIKSRDISHFSRQMATMMASGIPLMQAFDTVSRGQQNPEMQKLIREIKGRVEEGSTFAEALGKHKKYFNDLYVNLVDAGEQSGTLEVMLEKIATYKERLESLKGKVRKALFYPAAVLVVAIIVSIILLIFVVPQFAALYKGFGADLPMMTQFVINMSNFISENWILLLFSLFIFIAGLLEYYKRSEKFQKTLEAWSLRLPIFGNILRKAAIARFARTLSITFAAGLPLVDALKTVAGATGNAVYADATMKIREDVTAGQSMHVAMRMSNLFPHMVIQMVSIGEESGALDDMLTKVADFHEEEVNNAVDSLSSLLEPIIMAILGIVVGGLVVAMYLPIFKLGNVM